MKILVVSDTHRYQGNLYELFTQLDDIDYVLQGLLDIGFDEVYEVSQAAELVSEYTR